MRVSGRVQGVTFRDSCREQAAAHGVAGWVANEPDGTVAAEFEGPVEGVDALVSWCGDGPPGAHVDEVEVTALDPAGDSGFEVR